VPRRSHGQRWLADVPCGVDRLPLWPLWAAVAARCSGGCVQDREFSKECDNLDLASLLILPARSDRRLPAARCLPRRFSFSGLMRPVRQT
jgi:hypothetical protein